MKPIVAIIYDFDKTLCTTDMQNYTFIPNLDIKPEKFWKESNAYAKDQKMDPILAYMYMMIKKSQNESKPFRREDFVSHGKEIEFFPGIPEWFEQINNYCKEKKVSSEHYIISSGLKEIIEGTKIKRYFKDIFACEFLYDQNNVAVWPKMAINYTGKTQFLFRINKGISDISDHIIINEYIDEDDRRIPFRNMIYIGDGFTDIPCMKLVKSSGGHSIAVHKKRAKNTATKLLKENRVDFIAEADYQINSSLYGLVQQVIDKIVVTDRLIKLNKNQLGKN